MAKKRNFEEDLKTLVFATLGFLILLLSIFNLQNVGKKRNVEVLGAEKDDSYWIKLLEKHPTYRDGWIELGYTDKAREIDPNYLKSN